MENIEKLKKTRNELGSTIQKYEAKEELTTDEKLMLEYLKEQYAKLNAEIDKLKKVEEVNQEGKTHDNEVLKIKALTKEEETLFQECFDMFEELEKKGYYDERSEEHNEVEAFLNRVDAQEDFPTRKEDLIVMHYNLTKTLKEFKAKESSKTSKLVKRIGAGILALAVIVGAYAFAKNANKDKTSKDLKDEETTISYDVESYEYFIGKGVRESDAKELASNSTNIMTILRDNNQEDIKTNDVDELLYDIYEGKNITSTSEDYESYDTYADIGNRASTDIFNNMAGVPGYESINKEECANILDAYRYLDINDGSKYDNYNETLTDAIQSFYLNSNKETAQNLIDTMYKVNKEDGFLTPSLEGLLTEFMAGPGASVLVNYGELTVSSDLTDNKITANELINDLILQIEVFERECTYTRSAN